MIGSFIEEFIEGEDVDAALEPGYPRLLALRDAASYQQLIRDALGDQAVVAAPANLWQADETAGVVVDLVGAADLTAAGGATRTLQADVGSGDLDRAMTTTAASGQRWSAADAAAIPLPVGEAFAFVIAAEFPVQLGADNAAIGKGATVPTRFVGLFTSIAGHLSASWNDDAGSTDVATIAADHLDGVRRVMIFGASIVDEKMYVTSDLGDAEAVYPDTTDLDGPGVFAVGALEGGVLALAMAQDATHVAKFTGANAEAVLANRVALAARLLTL